MIIIEDLPDAKCFISLFFSHSLWDRYLYPIFIHEETESL